MRQIFDGFQLAHDFAQSESRKKKEPLLLCKFSINGIKYTVVDEKEKLWNDETILKKYNEKGEIVE